MAKADCSRAGALLVPLLLGLLATALGAASAEYIDPAVDWREDLPAKPPAYDPARLIAVEAPRGSTLSFGLDPQTLAVGSDGVVRYVVVASSRQGGADTAMFEGIRCSNGEFRTYARRNKGEADWSPADTSDPWRPLSGTGLAAHVLAISRAGVCIGRAPNTPIDQMVRDLRQAASEIR